MAAAISISPATLPQVLQTLEIRKFCLKFNPSLFRTFAKAYGQLRCFRVFAMSPERAMTKIVKIIWQWI